MRLDFIKMHGQGNDYLFFDLRGKTFPVINLEKLSIQISDRHFGVGSDGIVLILDDAENDAFMRIFNADGSEATMCGSALRCTTQLLAEENPQKDLFGISTLSGTKYGEKLPNGDIKVNLGVGKYLKQENFADRVFNLVDIGNPHAITFQDELHEGTAKKFGPALEHHFDANIEFVEILSRDEINLQVWERGSGVTLACGTGSCAAVCAGIKHNFLSDKVKVNLPGGSVIVKKSEDDFHLIGGVTKVFSSSWEV